jgi:RsiW-degrading membrane proteinase PrsW (M82 family)
MNYIEHVYICLIAPLLMAIPCARDRGRRVVGSIIIGMTACLLSSYISSFFAEIGGASLEIAAIEISPLVEELIKFMPVLVYLLLLSPEPDAVSESVMMIAIGFATLENVGYLLEKGAGNLMYLLIRGFGTGAMHVVCASIVIIGLNKLWKSEWPRMAGTLALLSVAITFHGVYNIMAAQTGIAAFIGYSIPLITVITIFIVRGRLKRSK